MIIDFFDDAKPCPPEIKNCEELRKQYKQDLNTLNPRTCKPCQLTSLKNKYLNIIQHRDK